MIVLGADPGGRTTGLVVRDGPDLLWHRLVDSGGCSGLPPTTYLHDVLDAIQEARETFGPLRYALESVTPPTGFYRGARDPIQPGSLIAVSAVAGYLLGSLPHVVLVPPAGNGSKPLSTYPAALVGDREKRGTGILRHARSAWDVAGHPNARRNNVTNDSFDDRFDRIAAHEDPDTSLDSDWDLRSPDQQRADYERAVDEIARLRTELARARAAEESS